MASANPEKKIRVLLAEDHTLVQKLVRDGKIDAEEAHRRRR